MGESENNKSCFDLFGCPDELKILRNAISKAPVAISVTHKNGRHLYHNPCFAHMFGYDVDEIDTGPYQSLIADKAVYKRIVTALQFDHAWAGDIEMKQRSGRPIPVFLEAEAVLDDTGGISAVIGTFTDRSKQRKTDQAAWFQNEYLSTLHTVSLGMFRRLNLSDLLNAVIVRASRLTRIPNGFLHLYDPEKKRLVVKAACGNLAGSIGFELEPGSGLAGLIFKTGEPAIIENYRQWPDRSEVDIFDDLLSIIGIPLVSGSKIEGVIGLGHHEVGSRIDPEIVTILEEFSAIAQIAIYNAKLFEVQKLEIKRRIKIEKERKEMEQKLHHSQRMESIGTLAGGIAHDFNNILTSIMGFTQIAMRDAPRDSAFENDLKEIYNASLRARDLIGQILSFARRTNDVAAPLRISLVAKEVLKFIRSSVPATIEILSRINSRLKVVADSTQTYQVFLNLLTNAAQAMESGGGKLTIEMHDIMLADPFQSLKPGQYVKIKISDTGKGIDPADIQKIFDPYFTTKGAGEGTGLGLSMVHGTVKRMGGEIFVESTIDVGSVFTLYLPAADVPDAKKTGPADLKLPTAGQGEHLLVVDDEELITRIQKRLLEKLGYNVTTFNDSEAALAHFKAYPKKYSAMITDMTMPNMTGDLLIKAVLEIEPGFPTVLCTGFDHYLTEESLKQMGILFFCKKPIIEFDLADSVRRAIDERSPMDEPTG